VIWLFVILVWALVCVLAVIDHLLHERMVLTPEDYMHRVGIQYLGRGFVVLGVLALVGAIFWEVFYVS
jgi:hypothetical protein